MSSLPPPGCQYAMCLALLWLLLLSIFLAAFCLAQVFLTARERGGRLARDVASVEELVQLQQGKENRRCLASDVVGVKELVQQQGEEENRVQERVEEPEEVLYQRKVKFEEQKEDQQEDNRQNQDKRQVQILKQKQQKGQGSTLLSEALSANLVQVMKCLGRKKDESGGKEEDKEKGSFRWLVTRMGKEDTAGEKEGEEAELEVIVLSNREPKVERLDGERGKMTRTRRRWWACWTWCSRKKKERVKKEVNIPVKDWEGKVNCR